MFKLEAVLSSKRIPQIACVFGMSTAGAAYWGWNELGISHCGIFRVQDQGRRFQFLKKPETHIVEHSLHRGCYGL